MNIFDAKKNGILNMWKIIGKTLNPHKEKSKTMIKRLLIEWKNITDDHQIAEATNINRLNQMGFQTESCIYQLNILKNH